MTAHDLSPQHPNNRHFTFDEDERRALRYKRIVWIATVLLVGSLVALGLELAGIIAW